MGYNNKFIITLILILILPMTLYSQTNRDMVLLDKYQFKKDSCQQWGKSAFHSDKLQTFDFTESFWKSQNDMILTQWECLGPEGGNVSDMVMDMFNPSIIYVAPASYPCPIFKTIDAGQSWSKVGIVDGSVLALAIDPNNPTTLYAAVEDEVLYKSTNGGVNWIGYQFSEDYDWIYSLATHPTNSHIIYAGADHWDGSNWVMAVMKSTDGGVHWQVLSSFGTESGAGFSIAIDPQHPDTVFVGGSSGSSPKVFRTYDGGTNWSDISNGLIGYGVNSLTIHPDITTVVFAGTDWRLFKSTNGGDLWNVNGFFLANDLAIDPNSTNTMYVASAGELYKSVDGGVNWNPTSSGTNIANISVVLVDPTAGNNVYAGGQLGILKTVDAGTEWISSNKGFIAAPVSELEISPAAPNVLYIVIDDDNIYKSEDKGQSWVRLQEFQGCDGILDFTVAPNNADIMYVLSGG